MNEEICFFDYICGRLKHFFKLVALVLLCMALIPAICFFTIEVDNSRLSEIRYCPSCGIDLLNK